MGTADEYFRFLHPIGPREQDRPREHTTGTQVQQTADHEPVMPAPLTTSQESSQISGSEAIVNRYGVF